MLNFLYQEFDFFVPVPNLLFIHCNFYFGIFILNIGLRAIDKPIFKEPFSRHRSIMNLYEK